MRITSKGQVTIPQSVRERCGLLPHTEVRFVEEGGRGAAAAQGTVAHAPEHR
jgi:AbrB family looped-hinge helix DNA binding protein